MSKRVRRNTMVHAAWSNEQYESVVLYKLNSAAIGSEDPDAFYHSASITQLWVLGLQLNQPRTLELILKPDGEDGQSYLLPVTLSGGDGHINLVSLVPGSGIRQSLEFGLGYTLKARLEASPGATGKVVVNGCVEENGVIPTNELGI